MRWASAIGALPAVASLTLASCTSLRSPDTVVLTPSTVLIVVPALPQQPQRDDQREIGTLASLCDYWGVEMPAAASRRLAAADRKGGPSGAELRDALRESGLDAYLFQGTLDWEATGLYRQVDLDCPPLVMISRDGVERYACLFTGYDCTSETVYLYDALRGHLRLPTRDFEALWDNALRFTLLALPHVDPSPAEERVEAPEGVDVVGLQAES